MVLILTCLSLVNCTLIPTKLPTTRAEVVVEEIEQPEPEQAPTVVTHGLEQDEDIIVLEDPQTLVEQANQSPIQERPALLIRAAHLFLDQNQINSIQYIINELDRYPLTSRERFDFHIVKTRLASQTGDHARALQLVNLVNLNQIPSVQTKIQLQEAKADSQLALGQQTEGLITLLSLDSLLLGEIRQHNQRRILQTIRGLDPLQLSLARENTSIAELPGWLALSDVLHTSAGKPERLEQALVNWRGVFPNHPTSPELITQFTHLNQVDQFRQIALLMPLTSPFGSAAQAFYDGFIEAHNNDDSLIRPNINLYDIGPDPLLTPFYYQAAEVDGADFIVGPLGKKAVESLLARNDPKTNTLLIADIPPEKAAENLYSISLSPENEARQAAEKAYHAGLRAASVFRNEGEWGERVARAFTEHWESLGGNVIKNSYFPADISDYSRVIQKFVGLDKSISRHRLIEAQTGVNLKFSPRRNEDLDFIFLAATATQARLVVPQLRFFEAHDLPIYATSYIYSGTPEPAVDADLDGLIFGEMPWILQSVDLYKQIKAQKKALKEALLAETKAISNQQTTGEDPDELNGTTENQEITEQSTLSSTVIEPANSQALLEESSDNALDGSLENAFSQIPLEPYAVVERPYKNTGLDRLYALGVQSYQMIPHLKGLRTNTWNQFEGEAMTMSVDKQGNTIRHPIWVKFKSGLAEPLAESE